MSTPLIFKVFDIGEKLNSTFFFPMTVSWNIQTHRINYRSDGDKFSKGEIFWLIDTFFFFGILGIGGLAVDLFYLMNAAPDDPLYVEISQSKHMLTSRIVLALMNFGGCAFVLGAINWGDEIGSVSNGFLDFEEMMKKKLGEKKRNSVDIYGVILSGVLLLGIIGPPLPAIITVVRGQDPLYTIFRLTFPQKWFRLFSFKLLTFVIRLSVILKIGYEIGRILVLLGCVLILFCRVLMNTIQMLKRFYDSIGNGQKLRGDHVSIYSQFWLLMRIATRCNSAPLLLGGIVIDVLFMTFAVILIKLRDRQPLVILLIAGTIVVCMVIGLYILLPLAVGIYDESVDIIHKWSYDYRVKGQNKAYLRKRLNTLKKFYYYVGYEETKMFILDSENASGVVEGFVMHTTDVLLTTEF